MNIFVASWFFPPATSSEGIVTYKLLRNSQYDYDVFSSTSRQWGYKTAMAARQDGNIHSYTIETDSIEEWQEACVKKFEELYPKRKYGCIMTRSTPPESILVGEKIKAAHPEIKWIASLADPVANNPYELKAYVDECPTLNDPQKAALKAALKSTSEEALKPWEKRPEGGIQLLCKLKRMENTVLQQADLVISPSSRQLRYLLGERGWMPKCFPVPHSFDETFYEPVQAPAKKDKIVFSFIGYSDKLRSLEPIVRAVRYLREKNSPALDRLEIHFIGNNPRAIQDMVLNYYLDDVIHFEPGVDYYESLKRMQQSDWLIHMDAFFPELNPGGSIFFAGKLADYMGAGKPIFALTGKGSPADQIVKLYGGVSVPSWEISLIAQNLEKILYGEIPCEINLQYRSQYNAAAVAAAFDKRVGLVCNTEWNPAGIAWPEAVQSSEEKLVTICVPSYNVQRYLSRCVATLVNHPMAGHVEVLIVDDGSKDHTADIGRAYEAHFPGIVRLIHKENGGHGSTINRALKEAKGRYFMVVDGDDWLDSDQFAKLLTRIESKDIDTDIISSNYHEIDMETGICSEWKQATEVEYDVARPLEELDLDKIYFTLASSLIKTDVLRQENMPLQEHTFYVDVEYILFPVPYLHTATFVNYCIYKYCRGNAEQSVYIPTMVKRYDHHERVMRRVIQYEQDRTLSAAQKRYYDAILKRLLYTHYSLCLVYNPDKEEGFARGSNFDAFLCKTNPELAAWIAGKMPILKVARRYHFNYKKIKGSFGAKLAQGRIHLHEKFKNSAKNLLNSGTVRKIMLGTKAAKISRSHFFMEGGGKKIKAALSKFYYNKG